MALPPPEPAPNVWRRWVLPALFVGALFVVTFTRGRDGAPASRTVTTFAGATMGTTYAVKIVTGPLDPKSHQLIDATIGDTLEAVNASMSTWRRDSELSTWNAAESTEARPATAALRAVLSEAARIGASSDGAFDVTVGPLVNAWGFGPDGEQKAPDEADLAALRARVGVDKVIVDEAAGTVRKTRPDVYVDLSAIAKGYGVDRLAEAVEGLDYDEYLVEIGGELRGRGKNADGVAWRVGIEKPEPDADPTSRPIREIVALDDAALATSGDYRNYYEREGVRLSHTIDPRTGRPITHRLASVSVITDRCSTADAYATALNVLGPDAGYTLAEREQLAALFVVRTADGTFTERVTPAFEALRRASAAPKADSEGRAE